MVTATTLKIVVKFIDFHFSLIKTDAKGIIDMLKSVCTDALIIFKHQNIPNQHNNVVIFIIKNAFGSCFAIWKIAATLFRLSNIKKTQQVKKIEKVIRFTEISAKSTLIKTVEYAVNKI